MTPELGFLPGSLITVAKRRDSLRAVLTGQRGVRKTFLTVPVNLGNRIGLGLRKLFSVCRVV